MSKGKRTFQPNNRRRARTHGWILEFEPASARLAELPPGTGVVVRALPPAALASSTELAADLDAGLRTALRKLTGGPG